MSDGNPTANPPLILDTLFNTPVESGVRSLVLLIEAAAEGCDLERLVIYDYLLVHSQDFDGGPPSLHPPSPFRSGELLVRRNLIKSGLRLVHRKGLVTERYDATGISYVPTKIAPLFLAYLESEYAVQLRAMARWVGKQFGGMPDAELRRFVDTQLGAWGADFSYEALPEEDAV